MREAWEPCIHPSIRPFIHPSIRPFTHPSICPFIHPSIVRSRWSKVHIFLCARHYQWAAFKLKLLGQVASIRSLLDCKLTVLTKALLANGSKDNSRNELMPQMFGRFLKSALISTYKSKVLNRLPITLRIRNRIIFLASKPQLGLAPKISLWLYEQSLIFLVRCAQWAECILLSLGPGPL